jgi:hypothetical protein
MESSSENPFDSHLSTIEIDGNTYKYYDLAKLNNKKVD